MENNILKIKYIKSKLVEEKIKRMIIESQLPEPPIQMINELENKKLGVYMKEGSTSWHWRFSNLYLLSLQDLCDLNNSIAESWEKIDEEKTMDAFYKFKIILEVE